MGTRISPRARSSAADRAAVWPQLRRRNTTRTCSGSRRWIASSLRGRAVGRAVVDEDQLVVDRQRRKHRVELGVQRLDVVDLVEHRNQDRKVDSVSCDHVESVELS